MPKTGGRKTTKNNSRRVHKKNPCWKGYRRNYNKRTFTKGSCVRKKK